MSDTYARLSNTLDVLLAERKHTIEPAPSGSDPLILLLDAKPDLIGFAQLNGEAEAGFTKALEKFKSLYVVRSTQWSNYDLTLVICCSHREDEEAFWTEKELDPYFCRKFVIDSNGTMESDLARLPFVPLQPERVVGLARPPSAQTLLMNLGVTSRLAEGLAVPHRLGERRIIEECLTDRKSPPAIRTSRPKMANHVDSLSTSKVRLKELEISDFRAYRKSRRFDLDSDLIVMYGPNGLGKTSFFDAIDFVCTGGVTRLDERFRRRSSRLIQSLKHLDSKNGESHVRAVFRVNGNDMKIERWLHDRTNASIDGSVKDRTEALVSLIALSGDTLDMRIENLVRLFRSTHLFGQDFQTLTSELRDDSRLPEDTVSRMLAFQDYVEAISKTTKVSKEITQQKEKCEIELDSLRQTIAVKRSEQDKFDSLKKAAETPESIEKLGRGLVRRMNKETELELEPSSTISIDDVSGWRVMLEGTIASINDQLAARQSLLPKLFELAQLRETLLQENRKTVAATKALSETDSECARRKQALDNASAKSQELLTNENRLTSMRDNLTWLSRNLDEHRKLSSQIKTSEAEIESTQRRLAELSETLALETENSKNVQREVSELESKLSTLNQSLQAMSEFEKQLADWERVDDRLVELRKNLAISEDIIQKARAEIKTRLQESKRLEESAKDLEKAIQEKRRAQSEFDKLLESVENYVTDKTCPVCGANHNSQDDLLKAIRQRIGISPAGLAEILKNAETARATLSSSRKAISELERNAEIAELEKERIKEEEKELLALSNHYKRRARELELPEDGKAGKPEARARIQSLSKSLEATSSALRAKQSELKKDQDRSASLSKQRDEANRSLNAIRASAAKVKEILSAIESGAVTRKVSINRDSTSIETESDTVGKELRELRTRFEQQNNAVTEAQAHYNSVLQEQRSTARSLQEAKNREKQIGTSILRIESELARNGLNVTIAAEELNSMLETEKKRVTALESLRDDISRFEVVLDEAQISATFARLKRELENLERRQSEVANDVKLHDEWDTYFTKLRTELESVQKRSLRDYVRKYGPLTSSIQKRLRSVYGFEDLQLSQEKGGIAIRVKRKGGEYVRPPDYFSESQIQIVMLSLFLSAVLTQTWSAFAPILLDDPVTHFDDLNAYSFLDVIRGLIEKPGEGHQFILSTCEERLYRLMRQKFAKLPGKVIYYEFESIGDNGPVVKEA